RPALTRPATAVCGCWRQRPHKSVAAGVIGHIRRRAPVVPAITAAPRGTWPPSSCPRQGQDHGAGASGAWQNKAENPGPADQAPRLVIEWTADLSPAATSPPPQGNRD